MQTGNGLTIALGTALGQKEVEHLFQGFEIRHAKERPAFTDLPDQPDPNQPADMVGQGRGRYADFTLNLSHRHTLAAGLYQVTKYGQSCGIPEFGQPFCDDFDFHGGNISRSKKFVNYISKNIEIFFYVLRSGLRQTENGPFNSCL